MDAQRLATIRSVIRIGRSSAVSIPVDFAKTLSERGLRKVVVYHLGDVLCVVPGEEAQPVRDLTKIALASIDALTFAVEDKNVKRNLLNLSEELERFLGEDGS